MIYVYKFKKKDIYHFKFQYEIIAMNIPLGSYHFLKYQTPSRRLDRLLPLKKIHKIALPPKFHARGARVRVMDNQIANRLGAPPAGGRRRRCKNNSESLLSAIGRKRAIFREFGMFPV